MVMKIWDSTSNNEIIIVLSTAKELDRHRVLVLTSLRQKSAFLTGRKRFCIGPTVCSICLMWCWRSRGGIHCTA